MADSVQSRGRDTYISSARKNQDYAQTPTLRVSSGAAKVYTHLALPGVTGRTVESAPLSFPVKGSWAAQTLTVTPIAEEWSPRETTWNRQPALRTAQAITVDVPAKTDQQRVTVDVAAHVQAVANGAAHWGWCITTSSGADNRIYGFDSTLPDGSWSLAIDYADAPEAPTDLSPNGGDVGIVPVLMHDFNDYGGESTDLASVRAQVNTAATEVGAWDSGHVPATVPGFNLATSAWPTVPVAGTRYYWRVFVKDGAGVESDPSDWASFVYQPKPAFVVDNPSGGVVFDPSPTIAGHLASGEVLAWRIRVTAGTNRSKELYDSGKKPGTGSAELAFTLPFKDDDKRRILKDAGAYSLNIRIWENDNREATPGDPTYIETWVDFTMDDDATPAPPSDTWAVQVGHTPRVRFTWMWLGSAAVVEGWVIRRDGQVIARLEPDEVTVGAGGAYSWVDSTAVPFVSHTYEAKIITGGKQSRPSPPAEITPVASGVWLLSDDTEVEIDGKQVAGFRKTDRRATYQPLNSPYDVDIVNALGTLSAPFEGTISTRDGRDVMADKALLEDLGERPSQVVQLVYGTRSVPVRLRHVSVDPGEDFQKHNMLHRVSFEAYLAGA